MILHRTILTERWETDIGFGGMPWKRYGLGFMGVRSGNIGTGRRLTEVKADIIRALLQFVTASEMERRRMNGLDDHLMATSNGLQACIYHAMYAFLSTFRFNRVSHYW